MNKLLLIVAAMAVSSCVIEAAEEYNWGAKVVEFVPSDQTEIARVSDPSLANFCLKSRDYFVNFLGQQEHSPIYRMAYEILFELVDGDTLDSVSHQSHYQTLLEQLAAQDTSSVNESFEAMMARAEYKEIFGGLIVACNKIPEIHRHLLDMMSETSAVDLEQTGCETSARVEKINGLCALAYTIKGRLLQILNSERAQNQLDPWGA